MDNVDRTYEHNIMQALQSRNIERLKELVPGIDSEKAEEYINRWQENYNSIMSGVRGGLDTSKTEDSSLQMLNELLEEANLSGFHR